jgi:hypothetical protein
VHQTTAGKMIFGRYDERGEQSRPGPAVAPPNEPAGNRGGENGPGGERPRPLYPESGRS